METVMVMMMNFSDKLGSTDGITDGISLSYTDGSNEGKRQDWAYCLELMLGSKMELCLA